MTEGGGIETLENANEPLALYGVSGILCHE